MPTVKELQERRALIGAEIRKMADKINAENRDFSAEEKVQWEKANTDFNDLTRQIDLSRRAEEVDATLNARRGGVPGREDTTERRSKPNDRSPASVRAEARALTLQAWLLRGAKRPLKDRHVRACESLGFNPNAQEIDIRLTRRGVEARALSVGTTTAGGFTVPQGFVDNLERALLQYNGPRQVADVMRTATGQPLPWPSVNDTGNVGELLAENTTAANQDVVFAQTTFNAYKYGSKLVAVSSELLNDSAFDLATELGSILGERIGRIQAAHFTTGTGTSQPQGVVTGATLGQTGASTTAIAADEILGLIHSVDPAYRADPSFALMMSDTVLAAVRKLKDSQNRYLFNDDQMTTGAGSGPFAGKVFGVPVVVNQQMTTALTTGQKIMLAGAFRFYKIRDVNTIRLMRSDDRYFEVDQTAFVAFLRSDGRVLDAGTHPIKYYALA